MSTNTKLNAAIVAVLSANNALIAALQADLEGGDASASTGNTGEATTTTRGRGRPSNADKAAADKAGTSSTPKLTNDEVAAIVTKVKDHPKGGLPTAKALIAEVGVKKIAEIKDQETLQKLKDAAESKLAELEDGGDEEL